MSYLSCWQNFGIFDAKISTINIIISLDLSNFDISSIENMNNMFYDCNDYLVYCAKNNSKTKNLLIIYMIHHIYLNIIIIALISFLIHIKNNIRY